MHVVMVDGSTSLRAEVVQVSVQLIGFFFLFFRVSVIACCPQVMALLFLRS